VIVRRAPVLPRTPGVPPNPSFRPSACGGNRIRRQAAQDRSIMPIQLRIALSTDFREQAFIGHRRAYVFHFTKPRER
jgi:hypothetical protein